MLTGDILAKDFDCSFSEVAAADQVTEVVLLLKLTFSVVVKT